MPSTRFFSPARLRLRLVALAGITVSSIVLGVTPGHADSATGSVGGPAFTIYNPPAGSPGEHTAAEPSIGVDWKTGAAMYQADLTTYRVNFDDASPAAATWTDVSSPLTSQTTLDPILFTDSATGRTFVSQLAGECSLTEFSDDDGANWTPSEGCGPPSGVDHQTIGSGPFAPPVPEPPAPAYPHAVYYCSQGVAAAFCAASVDGGLTFQEGVPIYTDTQCGGLHGHVKVAPNGTTVVPNQNCGPSPDPSNVLGQFPNQGAVVSTTEGQTWSVNVVPDSHSTLRSDPSVAFDKNNTMYFGYEDAVESPSGEQVGGHPLVASLPTGSSTWSPSVDVGAPLGIQNVTFPEMAAGDAGHAAYAFLGSTTAGDTENQTFKGYWYLYVATTDDGWNTFSVQNLTPNDPVERGCIYLSGSGDCPETNKRNLLDFMDMTSDAHGRVLIGYADGCTGTCVTQQTEPCSDEACNSGPTASTDRYTSIAREECGSLIAGDPFACDASPIPTTPEAPFVPALVVVSALGIGGAYWVNSRRRRMAVSS